MNKVFFTLGGAEAIENAIKLARHYTGRYKLLARYRAYHGATFGAMTLTGDPRRWANEPGPRRRRPLPGHPPLGRGRAAPGRGVAPGPRGRDQVRGPAARSRRSSSRRSSAPTASSSRPTATSQGVREICDRYGILMVCDEVMAGFGRTGRWFAVDHWDVVPDLMTMAKGLTSSYLPLGAVAHARHDRRGAWRARCSTAASPTAATRSACAAALATIARLRGGRPHRQRRAPRRRHARATTRRSRPSTRRVGAHRNLGLFGILELVRVARPVDADDRRSTAPATR